MANRTSRATDHTVTERTTVSGFAALPRPLGLRPTLGDVAVLLGYDRWGWINDRQAKEAVHARLTQLANQHAAESFDPVKLAKANTLLAAERDRQRIRISDQLAPVDFRRQHDPTGLDRAGVGVLYPLEAEAAKLGHAQIKDSAGRISSPSRATDTLAVMYLRGSIDEAQFDAGRYFQVDFAIASFPDVKAVNLERVSAGGGGSDLRDRQADARNDIAGALKTVGGLTSDAGAICWHVLGLGETIRDWIQARVLQRRRPLNPHVAAGIMQGALSALGSFYNVGELKKFEQQVDRGAAA